MSLIDPATDTVVGEITGIEVGHGVQAAPDGSRIYVTNESLATLDVVDAPTLKIIKRIPLTGPPNNVAVRKDGQRVMRPSRVPTAASTSSTPRSSRRSSSSACSAASTIRS